MPKPRDYGYQFRKKKIASSRNLSLVCYTTYARFGFSLNWDLYPVYTLVWLKNAGHIPVNVLIVSLASTEFKNGSGVNECANTDNMSDVHCKFKRPGACLTYGVTLGVQVCGLRLERRRRTYGSLPLFLGIWWRAVFVIFALSSGIHLNLLNYWKVKSWFHVWKSFCGYHLCVLRLSYGVLRYPAVFRHTVYTCFIV